MTPDSTRETSRLTSRRSVAAGFWAAPAVLAAAAAPAASASTPQPPAEPPRHDPHPAEVSHREHLAGRFRPYWGGVDYRSKTGDYFSKLVNDVMSADTSNTWASMRANHVWRNLTPGKAYTFTVSAQVAPYDECPAMSSSQTIIVSSSPDRNSWTEHGNFRGKVSGQNPPAATTAPTVLSYGVADDVCNNHGKWGGLGPAQTITFTQTAGSGGTIWFRYDTWYQARDKDFHYSRVAGYEVPTGNDRMQISVPAIVA